MFLKIVTVLLVFSIVIWNLGQVYMIIQEEEENKILY